MNRIFIIIYSYLASRSGATAVEYGLIAGGISLSIIVGVVAFGDALEPLYTSIGNALAEFTPAVDDQDYNLAGT